LPKNGSEALAPQFPNQHRRTARQTKVLQRNGDSRGNSDEEEPESTAIACTSEGMAVLQLECFNGNTVDDAECWVHKTGD
jgi:hypothetical protein